MLICLGLIQQIEKEKESANFPCEWRKQRNYPSSRQFVKNVMVMDVTHAFDAIIQGSFDSACCLKQFSYLFAISFHFFFFHFLSSFVRLQNFFVHADFFFYIEWFIFLVLFFRLFFPIFFSLKWNFRVMSFVYFSMEES